MPIKESIKRLYDFIGDNTWIGGETNVKWQAACKAAQQYTAAHPFRVKLVRSWMNQTAQELLLGEQTVIYARGEVVHAEGEEPQASK